MIKCTAYQDGCPGRKDCEAGGKCVEASVLPPITPEMFEESRRRLNGRTISMMLQPAHMADWYRAVRALEPQLQPQTNPPDVVALDPPEFYSVSVPDDLSDRIELSMHQRITSLLECARQIGFGEASAAYLTTDGNLELSVRLSIRARVANSPSENEREPGR